MSTPATTEPTDRSTLDGLRSTPETHFRLHFYAAVHRVLWYLHHLSVLRDERLQDWLERYPFLAGYMAELTRVMPRGMTWGEALAWWERELDAWEHTGEDHLPLRALADGLSLTWRGRLAFMLVGLPEEDLRFGTVFAELQSPLPRRRPCLELVGRILSEGEAGVGLDPWSVCRPLLESDVLLPLDAAAPRAEWVLRVPGALWEAARGEATAVPDRRFRFRSATEFPDSTELVFPRRFTSRVVQVPGLIRAGKADVLMVRGSRGSERLTVGGSVARALGRHLVVAEAEVAASHASVLGPLCLMTGSLPAIVYDLTPGETADVPSLSAYGGPVACVLGHEGGLRGESVEKAVTLKLPALGRNERARHWRRAFGARPVPDLEEITDRFHLPGGHIRQAAAKAVAQAALEGREEVRVADVRGACRLLNRQLLDTLAEHLDVDELDSSPETSGIGWKPLVVEEGALSKLRELEQRGRHRERLLGHLGSAFGSNKNRGVRALFSGPSGTGKTLAAKIAAAKLGLDLYRVDLASVINKYIGETEKNLHRVLTTAEELDVILLLDEGDALLGNRTEVKSSNDRYANLETNYLLQRLEHYQGIVIVTTNLGDNIDEAFKRRMDLVVDFLPPRAEARLRIWRVHLPERHQVSAEFLDEVARRCRLTGGQIRNAAELATLLALDEGTRLVEDRHLREAVRSEYRKAGATLPLDGDGKAPTQSRNLQSFLDAFPA